MQNHSSEEIKTSPESALEAFFENFGKIDIYSQIVIEEFMEALLEEKK